MHQLMILAAKMLPEEILLKKLKEAITNYEEKRDKESKHILSVCLLLAVIRYDPDEENKDIFDVIKDVEKRKAWFDAMPKDERID